MKWNAISRVEVDHHSNGARNIVIDADASTYIMNAEVKSTQDAAFKVLGLRWSGGS